MLSYGACANYYYYSLSIFVNLIDLCGGSCNWPASWYGDVRLPFGLPLFHFHLTSDYLMRSDYILYIQCINRLLTVVVAPVPIAVTTSHTRL